MKKIITASFIVFTLAGCAQQTFTMHSDNPNATTKEATKEISHHFFISGLGQSKIIDAAAICNGSDKIVKVESQHTFVNELLSFVTFGIYTPRQARVYCAN